MKTTEELKQYKSMDLATLEKEMFELKKKLAGYSLKVQAGKLDNYSLIKKTKKNVARLNSLIVEKSLES